MKILEYIYLPLLALLLLVIGLFLLIRPAKMQDLLFRMGLNKVQHEIMGDKVHLIFLRIIGATLSGFAILSVLLFIKLVRS
jgi:hypothetical protein